jgi:polysaccharide pyruvyl transferase WcaK-like protein
MFRLTYQPDSEEFRRALRKRSPKTFISLFKRGIILPLLPQAILQSMGKLNARNVIALLDCSGFAYGDQWSPKRMISRTKYYRSLRNRGVKLIMLPQALGPFKEPDTRSHAVEMFEQFNIIFPREKTSEQHVLQLGIDGDKVISCPDISHLLEGKQPPQPEVWNNRVAIVPNSRMLDKTDSDISDNYLNFLKICVDRVIANDLEPVILQHETNDDVLIAQLLEELDTQPDVVNTDGAAIKGILKNCYANFGSRYHSLVSSLSQAVPTLGTSWAHKYEALFAEYDSEDCLISPAEQVEVLSRKINGFLAPENNKQLREKLQIHAATQKEKVERMWQRVEAIISSN